MANPEELAREIVKYVFEHDILTQHGMAGIRKKIENIVTPADNLHALALMRIDKIFNAAAGTPEGEELEELSKAVEAYESVRWPID